MQDPVFDPSSPLYIAQTLTWSHTADILIRLLCAFVFGAFVAHRPWRKVVATARRACRWTRRRRSRSFAWPPPC